MSQQPASPDAQVSVPVPVWDGLLRGFHWTLLLLVSAAIATGLAGGDWMAWHARAGEAIAALLALRLSWGLWGSRYARFAQFWPTPARLWAYLRGRWQGLGHNPLGALSVLAMLALLLAQVATGLVGDDEVSFTGPLNRFVSSATGLAATWYHKRVGQWVIVTLVALHVAAVLFYLWKRGENLVRPMVQGDKNVGGGTMVASRDDWRSRATALLVLLCCAAAVATLVQIGR